MLYSKMNRLAQAAWLFNEDKREFYHVLKLVKFVFFYEIFSEVKNIETASLDFKIYEQGPVDTRLRGDFEFRTEEFMDKIHEIKDSITNIDTDIAKKAYWTINTLNRHEVSELTHKFDYWKKGVPKNGKWANSNIEGDPSDFSQSDRELAQLLFDMADINIIDNSSVVHFNGKHFVLNNDDFEKLSEKQQKTLEELSEIEDDSLQNPIYVTLEEGGEIIID
ncbi:hypothetical protein [Leuconostoc mesenteroides]|uniref:hypothetical protein n=1 Tax=Leuconostoc mesenteroides TaxID=1245 RepID=UPI00112AC7DD|nr:hypothetical protein [Leuconostoc mesenteroides]TPF02339.1 hypothetical protein DIS10_07160 [Leuconostoc mesenteroides]